MEFAVSYSVGRRAAFQFIIAAAVAACYDGFWGGGGDGREGQNWQQESGCADEHVD